MAYSPTKLYRGQPSNVSAETLYTVVTGQTIIVKEISLVNVTDLDATITVYFVEDGGTAGNENTIISNITINARDTIIVELSNVLSTDETIQAIQGTSEAITMHISGVVIS